MANNPTQLTILQDEIRRRYDTLSKRLKQVARYILDNSNSVAFDTVASIAQQADVPPSTLIRFANAFGFSGFNEMKQMFKQHLMEETANYTERARLFRQTTSDESSPPETPTEILNMFTMVNNQALQQLAKLPSVTKDGHAIRLYANLAGTDDLPLLQQSGAEGVGLLRSEFLYLGRSSYPTEDELFASYRQLVQAMDGREIIIRTLDIGADKKADYFDLPPEDNPALGLRAIRLCLTRPALLQTQLCAILRASAFGNVGVMFPMVTGPAELAQLKAALRDAEDTLCARGERFGRYQTGVMIETPAAVFMSRELAREVDFFSIGTNDLTQYLLAMDRQNPALAPFCDPHHPAVLRAIEETVRNAHLEGCRVGICGELAADESLTQTFLRLGVDELSVSPPRILPLRRAIRDMTLA